MTYNVFGGTLNLALSICLIYLYKGVHCEQHVVYCLPTGVYAKATVI